MPSRKALLANSIACFIVVGFLIFIWCWGCSYTHVKGGSRQPAAIEQVLTWNAALAEANLGVAKGIIGANEAGEIDVATSNLILTQQSLIADADRQLTPILAKACAPQKQIQACNPAILSGDADTIENFVDQIRDSAKRLVGDGTAGIKNKQRAEVVQKSIDLIYSLIDNIVGSLQQLGVLKTKTANMACQLLPDGVAVSLSTVSVDGSLSWTTTVCTTGSIQWIYGTGRACPSDEPILCLAEVNR